MITARNTNTAMTPVYDYIDSKGVEENTRQGRVLSLPHPLMIEYERPNEMVNFCSIRNANPFFHFVEMLWMLEARGDLALIKRYVKRMEEYSDDGIGFNAHYGYNIRRHFNFDQLTEVIDVLRKDPTSRQAVVLIWNPVDLWVDKVTNDRACNLTLVFRVLNGTLCMTIFNRSNDAVWGAVSGANITNLGIFQLYVAAALELPVGKQWVVSNNLHMYLDNPQTTKLLKHYAGKYPTGNLLEKDPYTEGAVKPEPLLQPGETVQMLDRDISELMNTERNDWVSPAKMWETWFVLYTAIPLMLAHKNYRDGNMDGALLDASTIHATDWRLACTNWLQRKMK